MDKLLMERSLAPSRERAQAMIMAGRVLVNEQKLDKPGASIAVDSAIRILGDDLRYVSRGGLKLEHALQQWKIDLNDLFCLDIGVSTGGFTDCMLQHGALRILGVDTGAGQIAEKLRQDTRVDLRERTNARLLQPGDLPVGIRFFAMDVSFISATLVLPPVVGALRAAGGGAWNGRAVILVKPQFEAGREAVGKGGIVRDEAAQRGAIEKVRQCLAELGGRDMEVIDSPILGGEGNREFLLHVVFSAAEGTLS
ncbi:TlyA family RNA methyltransferase [Terriglobus sp. 2YAB30_2]|uniref:TlyA family RNA methyltransferase n=1 Tax=unclassified Terriglobus TaxID=2628988 RepID=UPI003F9D4C91